MNLQTGLWICQTRLTLSSAQLSRVCFKLCAKAAFLWHLNVNSVQKYFPPEEYYLAVNSIIIHLIVG